MPTRPRRILGPPAPDEAAEDAALIRAGKAVAEAARIAFRFQALKEDAKHHSLRELAVIRLPDAACTVRVAALYPSDESARAHAAGANNCNAKIVPRQHSRAGCGAFFVGFTYRDVLELSQP